MRIDVHIGEKVGGFVVRPVPLPAPVHEQAVGETAKHADDKHRVWPTDSAEVVVMGDIEALMQAGFDAPGGTIEAEPLLGAPSTAADPVDRSRGARRFGLRRGAVFLDREVLDGYSELDPALGLNVAGTILSVLSCQLAAHPSGGPSESTNVYLLRREDAQVVEVDLQIHRLRRRGRECLLLRKTHERSLEVQRD